VIGMFIGPPRAGKGTAVRVLNRLIGSANVTSPSMADLGGPFGLWSLMGKSLAVINDARLSARTDKGAVLERLLSISGEDNVSVNRKNLSPVETRLKCHLFGRDLRAALPNLRRSQPREGGERVRKHVGISLTTEGQKLLDNHNQALAAKKAWD